MRKPSSGPGGQGGPKGPRGPRSQGGRKAGPGGPTGGARGRSDRDRSGSDRGGRDQKSGGDRPEFKKRDFKTRDGDKPKWQRRDRDQGASGGTGAGDARGPRPPRADGDRPRSQRLGAGGPRGDKPKWQRRDRDQGASGGTGAGEPRGPRPPRADGDRPRFQRSDRDAPRGDKPNWKRRDRDQGSSGGSGAGEARGPRPPRADSDRPRFQRSDRDAPRGDKPNWQRRDRDQGSSGGSGAGEARGPRPPRADGDRPRFQRSDRDAPRGDKPNWKRRDRDQGSSGGSGAGEARGPRPPRADGDRPRFQRSDKDGPRGERERPPRPPHKPAPSFWSSEPRPAPWSKSANRDKKSGDRRDARDKPSGKGSDRKGSFQASRRIVSPDMTVATSTEPMRISKAMSRAGLCSRRDAERWIAEGRVRVNGRLLDSPAFDVGPSDIVLVDGNPLPQAEPARLWRYHKPKGLVTTHRDPEGRPTVFDKLPPELPRVMSIGRLDYNTEGLLLLTNDGELARFMELPATGWLRRYRVRAHGRFTEAMIKALADGVEVDGVRYGPVEAVIDSVQGANTWLTIGIREGKNREVRNIMTALGLEVNRLIRISYGPFELGDLSPGGVDAVRRSHLADELGPEMAQRLGLSESPEARRERQGRPGGAAPRADDETAPTSAQGASEEDET